MFVDKHFNFTFVKMKMEMQMSMDGWILNCEDQKESLRKMSQRVEAREGSN